MNVYVKTEGWETDALEPALIPALFVWPDWPGKPATGGDRCGQGGRSVSVKRTVDSNAQYANKRSDRIQTDRRTRRTRDRCCL